MVHALTPEAELLLLLIGTRERRAAAAARVEWLAERVDYEALVEVATALRLLALSGARLEETVPGLAPEWFRAHAAATCERDRVNGLMLEQVTLRLVGALADRGVSALVLKGPALGERLYGDPGLRPSTDVDLLVAPGDFGRALAALEDYGYEHTKVDRWIGELPLFETSLVGGKDWLPPIDLHWRVHWYDDGFSTEMVARQPDTHRGLPVPSPRDQLATAVLMYAREGFLGAKGAADIAASWDAHEVELGDEPLTNVAEAHPELRRALAAAARVLEPLVGIPARRLVAESEVAPGALAVRLGNHSLEGDPERREAAATLIDWLLSPPGRRMDFVRRRILLPPAAVAEAYGRPEGGWAQPFMRGKYALAMLAQLCPDWLRLLWDVRGGRSLSGAPQLSPPPASESASGAAAVAA